jgi:hypothetical protein
MAGVRLPTFPLTVVRMDSLYIFHFAPAYLGHFHGQED